ncbi:MAG: oligopeptide transporter ATP-binding component [Pseudomonadota bacterium]
MNDPRTPDSPQPSAPRPPVLEVGELAVDIAGAPVLAGVSLTVGAGEALGLVGESGCGKSMTALAVLGLLPRAAQVRAGSVRLNGAQLLGAPEKTLRQVRGGSVGMIFQEPGACLDPVMRIGRQIGEVLRLHRGLRGAAEQKALRDLLEEVGLNDTERVARAYPHELSGGMQQRAMIAMALAGEPVLLIADEPTTALDARIASQILDLLDRLRRERGLALLLISHDLAVIGGRCDRVLVMYAGRAVEAAGANEVFDAARHPYTSALIAASPGLAGVARKAALRDIPGQLPPPGSAGPGCAFAPRCARARPVCGERLPAWTALDAAHAVRCLQFEEGW